MRGKRGKRPVQVSWQQTSCDLHREAACAVQLLPLCCGGVRAKLPFPEEWRFGLVSAQEQLILHFFWISEVALYRATCLVKRPPTPTLENVSHLVEFPAS